ncbi:hypothetical protein [Bacillus sp. FJAT-45350]|uniref:hypothetical protein n=1 Tax=Bacillus sp. FJAT-45350 TaxID=2011014 RepID=UPI000BB6EEF0|nr:hypothetical protein [Bacillus sp. FJAT-45350]
MLNQKNEFIDALCQYEQSIGSYSESLHKLYEAMIKLDTEPEEKEDLSQPLLQAKQNLSFLHHLINSKLSYYEGNELYPIIDTNKLIQERELFEDKVYNGENIQLFYYRKPSSSRLYIRTRQPAEPWFSGQWRGHKKKPLYTK